MSHIKIFRFLFTILVLITASASFAAEKQIDAATRKAVLDEIAKLLDQNYVYPETAAKMIAKIRARDAAGDYNQLTKADQFANIVSDDLRGVSKDHHLTFVYDPSLSERIRKSESKNEDEQKQEQARFEEEAKRDNYGFRKVERLPGNIGYIDFRYFADAAHAGPTAVGALHFLANCDVIIFDMRHNGCGDPSLIQLISSYFFNEATHLNDIYTRSEDHTENFWTLPYVPGPKMENADLYILTSKYTFSGAEEFCYNMKNLKRATLIGETTGGGAHPVQGMIVLTDFVLRVPIARAINPITKTNWEGTGVTPDIQVSAEQAYDKAYVMALEKLQSKATSAERKSEIQWTLDGAKAEMNHVTISDSVLKSYAGTYEDRKVTFENGSLHFRGHGPEFRLLPLTNTLFALEGLDDLRIEFILKDGKPSDLAVLSVDGSKEVAKRTSQ